MNNKKMKTGKWNSLLFKGISVALLFFVLPNSLFSQIVTIETCQAKAKDNYPMVKQYGLLEQTTAYNLSNANKGYLPQLTLSAKATYQSEAISITLNNMHLGQDKDQYQAVLEASQVIWDGGVISSQKKITKAMNEVEKNKLDVDLFALNDRVNQLYFGVLLLDEQIKQNEVLQSELGTNMTRVSALKQNGVANQTDVDALRVEQLNAQQKETDLKSTQKSFTTMLSALTGMKIDENTVLSKPEIDLAILNNSENNRPELKLLDAQYKMYDSQKSMITAGNTPKIGAFIQGGYGKPGLNMLSPEFSDFYIGGVRLSWNISGLYSHKNNIKKIETSQKTVDVQKETFLFNSELKTKQQKAEIEKLLSVVKTDDEIIRLRENIKIAASVKVDNGTSTVTDLIREINAEIQAKQSKSLHQIQLIMTVYQLKNNTNN